MRTPGVRWRIFDDHARARPAGWPRRCLGLRMFGMGMALGLQGAPPRRVRLMESWITETARQIVDDMLRSWWTEHQAGAEHMKAPVGHAMARGAVDAGPCGSYHFSSDQQGGQMAQIMKLVGSAPAPALSGSGRTAGWVSRAAAMAILAISVFGGVFPFFSAGLGLPLDGYPDGVVTVWRTVLHIVPGVLGILAGVVLLTAVGPRVVLVCTRLAVAVGTWFVAGPYVWSLVQPARAMGTGGLAGMSAGSHMSWIAMVAMPEPPGHGPVTASTANCIFTVGVCHWAVGGLIILASLVVMADRLGRGPLVRLGLARAALR